MKNVGTKYTKILCHKDYIHVVKYHPRVREEVESTLMWLQDLIGFPIITTIIVFFFPKYKVLFWVLFSVSLAFGGLIFSVRRVKYNRLTSVSSNILSNYYFQVGEKHNDLEYQNNDDPIIQLGHLIFISEAQREAFMDHFKDYGITPNKLQYLTSKDSIEISKESLIEIVITESRKIYPLEFWQTKFKGKKITSYFFTNMTYLHLKSKFITIDRLRDFYNLDELKYDMKCEYGFLLFSLKPTSTLFNHDLNIKDTENQKDLN